MAKRQAANARLDNLPALVPDPAIETAAPLPAPPIIDDPDDFALEQARAEVAAEQANPTQPEVIDRPAPRRLDPASPAEGTMVPKNRLDQALRAVKTARDEANYLKGALHARTQMAGQAAAPPANAQPRPAQAPATVDQQIAWLQGHIQIAAGKFDAGELTMTQYEKVRADADNQIAVLRARAILEVSAQQAAARAPVAGPADQSIMETQVAQLQAAFPYVMKLTEPEIDFIADICRKEAKALGRPFGPGHLEDMRLRHMIAEHAEHYWNHWYNRNPNGSLRMTQPAVQPVYQPAPAAQPGRPTRAQQGAQKIALAAQHPPNMAHTGNPSSSNELITDEQVDAMSTEEIMELPRAVRDRILLRG